FLAGRAQIGQQVHSVNAGTGAWLCVEIDIRDTRPGGHRGGGCLAPVTRVREKLSGESGLRREAASLRIGGWHDGGRRGLVLLRGWERLDVNVIIARRNS